MANPESLTGEVMSDKEIASEKGKKSVELRRAELKAAAYRRAQIALKHAYERIDYTLDVVEVEKQQIRENAQKGILPVFNVFLAGPKQIGR